MMALSDDTQQRVLEAAGQIFAEKGFEGATVREICQRAQVNIAAVNYYFRDKERLYIEAVKQACHEDAERVTLPEWQAGVPAEVRLRDFIRIVANRMLANNRPRWHTQLVLKEMAQPTAACTEWVQEQIRPLCQVLSGILKELLPNVPEQKLHLIGFSIIAQCVYHRVFNPIVTLLVGQEESATYEVNLLTEHITQFSLAALGLEKPIQEALAESQRRTKVSATRK
jgi:AcrR family transcriptional regulator